MTFVEERATRAGAGPAWVRSAGLACLVAGVLGARPDEVGPASTVPGRPGP